MNMLCGFRALEDYNQKEESVTAISCRLSAKQEDVVQAVCRLEEEITRQKEKIRRLQEQYLRRCLSEVKPRTQSVLLFEEELDPAAMRRFVNDAMEITEGVCGLSDGEEGTDREDTSGLVCV